MNQIRKIKVFSPKHEDSRGKREFCTKSTSAKKTGRWKTPGGKEETGPRDDIRVRRGKRREDKFP